jgi:hypothetical protein
MHEKAEIADKARIVMEIESEGEAYFEVDLGPRGIVHIKADKFEKVNVDTINARFGSNLTLKAIQ